MNVKLKRYWFEFDFNGHDIIPGVIIGCGVTGFDYDDAIGIIQKNVFKDKPIPKIKKVIEDVDVSTLDQGHVVPNMLTPNWRGIWFPIGHLSIYSRG